jgi:hypothetical protein
MYCFGREKKDVKHAKQQARARGRTAPMDQVNPEITKEKDKFLHDDDGRKKEKCMARIARGTNGCGVRSVGCLLFALQFRFPFCLLHYHATSPFSLSRLCLWLLLAGGVFNMYTDYFT